MAQKTAMQELLDHFNDEWSSPSDLWKPSVVIDKVESMLEKEKEQMADAVDAFLFSGKNLSIDEYYNETYKQD